ncbi:hypothetical protein TNCV_3375971 [Trichonephila clavipes]|nr:hypothetical protein TNCV_3375971 [Trichonephila clavipes]
MSPKKEKSLRKPLEHLKMWNEFVVDSDRYVTMIQPFFLPALQERDLGNEWLQQDGVTAHVSRISMGIL